MNRRDFLTGAGEAAPLLVAEIPIGLLWGTLAAGKGFTVFEVILTSMLVYAGSAQFVILEMWQDPLPVLLVTFTAFIVNIRHMLMGASLSRHIDPIPRKLHPLVAFFMVDESWALSEKRALTQPVTLSYYAGLCLPFALCWWISTAAGALLGRTMGDPAAYGLDFAFSALFIAIVMGFWKGSRTAAVLAASGAVAAMVKLSVTGAWYIVAGGIAGAGVAALLHSEEEAP